MYMLTQEAWGGLDSACLTRSQGIQMLLAPKQGTMPLRKGQENATYGQSFWLTEGMILRLGGPQGQELCLLSPMDSS